MPEAFRRTRERMRHLLTTAASGTDPLEQLAAVRQTREAIDTFEADALYKAREQGRDWAEIGAALHLSGQAAGKRARQRYQLADPRTNTSTGRPATRGTYRSTD